MNIIFDATTQIDYPVGKPGFSGGTELMLHKIAAGLSQKHTVHVVTPDLDDMEQRGPTLFYWPDAFHPNKADVVVMIHNLHNLAPYSAPLLILASNGVGKDVDGTDDTTEFIDGIDAVTCFSHTHVNLLKRFHPKVPIDKCFVTGLGVDIDDYNNMLYTSGNGKTPHRFLYANTPERGLWHTLKIFELIQKEIPDASLHITYNWPTVFEMYKWQANIIGQQVWECKDMIERIPNVTYTGRLSREEIIREQLECQIHMYPSSPPNVGSQIHGITQMECAAAGCALVLSDVEAFPEVFGHNGGAYTLPVPGALLTGEDRLLTHSDWAGFVVDLLNNPNELKESAQHARQLAENNTWDHVVVNWENMLDKLTNGNS